MNEADVSWRVELLVRVGTLEPCGIGFTDYPDAVPDLLRAAAIAWEKGRGSVERELSRSTAESTS